MIFGGVIDDSQELVRRCDIGFATTAAALDALIELLRLLPTSLVAGLYLGKTDAPGYDRAIGTSLVQIHTWVKNK